jgi:hypothetical protein
MYDKYQILLHISFIEIDILLFQGCLVKKDLSFCWLVVYGCRNSGTLPYKSKELLFCIQY